MADIDQSMKQDSDPASVVSNSHPRASNEKIVMYVPNLRGGGAQMVAVRLVNDMARTGQPAEVVVNNREGALADSVDSRVSVVDFGARRTLFALPRLVGYLRAHKPAAVISIMTFNNVNILIARMLTGWRGKLIITQHNTYSVEKKSGLKKRVFYAMLEMLVSRSVTIVAVSQAVADDMEASMGLRPGRIKVIYNPIITHDFYEKAAVEVQHPFFGSGGPVIVAVGRLVPQKDYPMLIRAMKIARQEKPVRLIVFGEGPLEDELKALASELGIAEAIDFAGYKDNVLPYIARADALILTSAFEGFGNVLAEALGCGTPAISTATNGPVEVLGDGRYGLIVPIGDASAAAAAILRTLDEPIPILTLKDSAKRFDSEAIASQYIAAAFEPAN